MKKLLILGSSILILLLSYILIIFIMIDSNKIENTIKELSSSQESSQIKIGNVEVIKLPRPKVILTSVSIGPLSFDKATLNIGFKSILMRDPKISDLSILDSGISTNLALYYEENRFIKAKGSGKISNIYSLLNSYIEIPEDSKNFLPTTDINLNFDIKLSENQLQINNLSIHSKRMNGQGEGYISLTEDSSNIKINFSNIALIDDRLENIDFALSVKESCLYLEKLSGNMTSGGEFKIVGDFTMDNNVPVFFGHLDLKHNNINDLVSKMKLNHLTSSTDSVCNFSSDIKITPIEFSSKNMTINVGDIIISGTNSFKIIGILPRITSEIQISGFDYNKETPIISPLIRYFVSLKDGMKEQDYVSKFIPLREVKSIGFFDIVLDKPVIGDMTVDIIKLSGNFLSGKIVVDSFEYKSDSTNLIGAIELSTSLLMPSFAVKVNSGNINMDAVDLNNILSLNKTLYQDYDLTKIKLSCDINIDSITTNDKEYKNVKITAYTAENSIIISNASLNCLNSSIITNGNISVSPDITFDFGYAYNSFNIKDIISYIVSGLDITGLVSSNGRISSYGSSIAELVYNLNITSKFLADSINIKGYDIDNVIDKINNLDYVFDNKKSMALQTNSTYGFSPLENDLEKATSHGNTTLSKVKGEMKMNLGSIVVNNLEFRTSKSTGNLHMYYNIYDNTLHLQSNINFSLMLSSNNSLDTSFAIILENNNDFFETFIDIKKLWTDIMRRPATYNIPSSLLNN